MPGYLQDFVTRSNVREGDVDSGVETSGSYQCPVHQYNTTIRLDR